MWMYGTKINPRCQVKNEKVSLQKSLDKKTGLEYHSSHSSGSYEAGLVIIVSKKW
jgi:hypothetical protein